MFLSERGQIALDHLEAGVTTEDFVQGVRHAFSGHLLFAFEVSLLLAGVKNNDAWHFTLFKVEDAAELGLRGHVQTHEHECDSTLNFARERILHVVHGHDNVVVE